MKKISIGKLLEKVETLTDQNNHTDARIEISKFFGNKKCLDKLNKINSMHLKIGYMTQEMITERTEITEELFKTIPFEYRNVLKKCL